MGKANLPLEVGLTLSGKVNATTRRTNPVDLCCSSANLEQCEPDEPGGFTGPRMGPGTYASLRLKLDARKRTSMGPSRSCWNGTTSALQLEEITSKGIRVSCVYSQ